MAENRQYIPEVVVVVAMPQRNELGSITEGENVAATMIDISKLVIVKTSGLNEDPKDPIIGLSSAACSEQLRLKSESTTPTVYTRRTGDRTK